MDTAGREGKFGRKPWGISSPKLPGVFSPCVEKGFHKRPLQDTTVTAPAVLDQVAFEVMLGDPPLPPELVRGEIALGDAALDRALADMQDFAISGMAYMRASLFMVSVLVSRIRIMGIVARRNPGGPPGGQAGVPARQGCDAPPCRHPGVTCECGGRAVSCRPPLEDGGAREIDDALSV